MISSRHPITSENGTTEVYKVSVIRAKNSNNYLKTRLSLDENGKVTGLVGSYPQVSGMRFEMDLTKTAYAEGVTDGERITAVYLVNQDGTETKLERTDATTQIAFASNDFLIAGGDGFTMLTNLKHILVSVFGENNDK